MWPGTKQVLDGKKMCHLAQNALRTALQTKSSEIHLEDDRGVLIPLGHGSAVNRAVHRHHHPRRRLPIHLLSM